MKCIKLILAITVAYAMSSCSAKNPSVSETERVEKEIISSDSCIISQDNSNLIKTVYAKFVFADVYPENAHPERYFTASALKKLKDNYDYDCEDNNCYAYYALRTGEQDYKPGTTGESEITDIESIGDNWYVVKYSDMGWSGMTRIKIIDGKIDDFIFDDFI